MKQKVIFLLFGLFLQSNFLQGQDPIHAFVPLESLKATRIVKVELNKEFTILSMKVFLPDNVFQIPVFIAPPGEPHSMYLQASGKKYALLKAEGISFYPEKTSAKRDADNEFTLYFEPLPEGVYIFDFIEPAIPGEDHAEPFTYKNVMLSRSPTKLVSLRFSNEHDFFNYLKKSNDPLESLWELTTEYTIEHRKKGMTETENFPTDTLVTVFEDEVYKFYFLNGFQSTHQFYLNHREKLFVYKRAYFHDTRNEIPFRMRNGNFRLEITIPNEEAEKILKRKIPNRYEVHKTVFFEKLDFPKR